LFVALCSAVGLAAAPDVLGVWNLSYTTREGQKLASTVTLKMEGEQIAGTLSSPRGSVPIQDVKVDGDNISFAVVRVGFGDTIRVDYTGKFKGDSMKLKMKVGAREPIDVTGTRGS
jgi:hypothetical protein